MNSKKLVLFGASAVVLAGVLVYALGIYPPASARDGRGAIGQRDVYRADQPADASVNPNAAPVAAADSAQVVTLQNGDLYQMSNGLRYQVQSGQMVPMQNGVVYRLNNGDMVKTDSGFLYRMESGQFVRQMNSNNFVHQLNTNQMVSLNGMMFKMMNNGQMQRLNMSVNQMHSDQMHTDQMHTDQMHINQMQNK